MRTLHLGLALAVMTAGLALAAASPVEAANYCVRPGVINGLDCGCPVGTTPTIMDRVGNTYHQCKPNAYADNHGYPTGSGITHRKPVADPVDPVDPVIPTDPVDPVDPVDPTDPVDPGHGHGGHGGEHGHGGDHGDDHGNGHGGNGHGNDGGHGGGNQGGGNGHGGGNNGGGHGQGGGH